jgi:hypothetical protein
MVPGIEPAEPIDLANYDEILHWSRKLDGELTVSSFLRGFSHYGAIIDEFGRATGGNLYHMTAPLDRFDSLLENDEWKMDALAYIKKRWH